MWLREGWQGFRAVVETLRGTRHRARGGLEEAGALERELEVIRKGLTVEGT